MRYKVTIEGIGDNDEDDNSWLTAREARSLGCALGAALEESRMCLPGGDEVFAIANAIQYIGIDKEEIAALYEHATAYIKKQTCDNL